MSEIVSMARSARENLARALGALQAPGVPDQLLVVAEPVAAAMRALHQIETSGGAMLVQEAPTALDSVRRALGLLQAETTDHPAVQDATAVVAGSLGLVFTLARAAQQGVPAPTPIAQPDWPGAAPPPQPAWSAETARPQPPPQQAAWPPAAPVQPAWVQPAQQRPLPQQPAAQAPAQPAHPAQPQQPAAQAPAQPAHPAQPQPPLAQAPTEQAYPVQRQQPAPAPVQPAWTQPAQPAPGAQPWPSQPLAEAPGHRAPAPAGKGGPVRVEAELGAHSPTNFYKGLSGNDVIESGGIFVATYNIPEMGQALLLRVSLPGGYEFEAKGVVRWTRDVRGAGSDTPPGFGAQFTEIPPEGRQLVYRYVRNREPLFHDDM